MPMSCWLKHLQRQIVDHTNLTSYIANLLECLQLLQNKSDDSVYYEDGSCNTSTAPCRKILSVALAHRTWPD